MKNGDLIQNKYNVTNSRYLYDYINSYNQLKILFISRSILCDYKVFNQVVFNFYSDIFRKFEGSE